ncbi:MAG: PD-(D/E)XK nuclease family transposase [Lachnospiraceae bacterium]|nr:Rpn family recombination-promoting nuclease/putative transposase [Lachnospiraceae bacterium]MDD7664046.1 PD-(D/E)XK nuclease family transposase [Lachnospiraceae bacterium]MDY4164230.1 PD-(D/E)XK nuclease family transposase [Lachnospiraceae bacterium]
MSEEFEKTKTDGVKKGRFSKEVVELVSRLTLFDDDLMSRVFDNNIEATELLLRIIFKRPIKVVRASGQEEIRSYSVDGRTIRLDIMAVDSDGKKIDIEVQTGEKGSDIKRARYHSSLLDSGMLKKGQDFSEIRDSYVVFIYKHDKFHAGLPVYHINRYVGETGEMFGDGSNIIYVNGTYAGDDDLGKLLADFMQPDASKINFKELANGVRYFKEEGGWENMCEAVEKYAEKKSEIAEKRGAINSRAEDIISIMTNAKLSLNQALDMLGVKGEERSLITEEVKKRQKAIS